jgi:glycine hydroxymethyltransferase
LTTRGFTEDDMRVVGKIIAETLKNPHDDRAKEKAKKIVLELTTQHPLYPEL